MMLLEEMEDVQSTQVVLPPSSMFGNL